VPYDAVEFARRLSERGVQTRPFFRGMHEQPVFQKMGLFHETDCPVTERIYRKGLYFPSGQAITDEQIERVISSVRSILS